MFGDFFHFKVLKTVDAIRSAEAVGACLGKREDLVSVARMREQSRASRLMRGGVSSLQWAHKSGKAGKIRTLLLCFQIGDSTSALWLHLMQQLLEPAKAHLRVRLSLACAVPQLHHRRF